MNKTPHLKLSLLLAAQLAASLLSAAEEVDPYSGEFFIDRRNQRGQLVVANCQTNARSAWLRNGVQLLADELFIDFAVKDARTFSLPSPRLEGTATLFVVDDPALPRSLIAPEDHWAMMNVCWLKDKKLSRFELRTMKAVLRSAIPLLGGLDSQYPKCLMGPVRFVKDLDEFPSLKLPVDVLTRMRNNLKKVGILPGKPTTYRQACEEGWASSPTNEIQKAIWEDVHSVPSNPIKIKFDPKKGE